MMTKDLIARRILGRHIIGTGVEQQGTRMVPYDDALRAVNTALGDIPDKNKMRSLGRGMGSLLGVAILSPFIFLCWGLAGIEDHLRRAIDDFPK